MGRHQRARDGADGQRAPAQGPGRAGVWSDLMQPQWKGKFAITDPSKSGTAYMLVYGLYSSSARPAWTRSRPTPWSRPRRAPPTGRGGGRIRRRHDAGIRRPGICRRRPEGDQAGLPGRGQLPAPEGMFIIKGAKNAQAAQALYEGLLSKEAQEAQLVKNFRRPTRSDVAVASLTTLPDRPRSRSSRSAEAAAQEYEAVVAAWGRRWPRRSKEELGGSAPGAHWHRGRRPDRRRRQAIRPAASTSWRPQRAASCGSCVTSTSVAPCSRCRSNIRSITFSPVAASSCR